MHPISHPIPRQPLTLQEPPAPHPRQNPKAEDAQPISCLSRIPSTIAWNKPCQIQLPDSSLTFIPEELLPIHQSCLLDPGLVALLATPHGPQAMKLWRKDHYLRR
ncbi:hypothetical protein BDA99DRAFT_511637, partial [Phascolomyces articulosus]